MQRFKTFGDVVERFRTNAQGYVPHFRVWLWLTGLAALADLLSTVHFMMRDGVEGELHPVIRVMSMLLGPIAGPVVGKFGQAAAVVVTTIFLRAHAIYIFVASTVLYAWAAWYNVWGASLYTPRFFRILEWVGISG